ncbi:hypothetical protein [Sulfurospirillum sp. hDNRA2]|uniref:hypothetical protein n=1 Tax=Sulfurospirillum sp. hDNRA2 TaxID=3237298 RepID=UPI0020B72131|nr:hypothetical protein [Sulfurospirillum sp. DNRA8]MCP3653261.1 hypothetical protein [Sulfurospirillum sp. DNRA8]MCR1812113.1 hypothetical protein [Sulfurospirillum sp. DNRA8]
MSTNTKTITDDLDKINNKLKALIEQQKKAKEQKRKLEEKIQKDFFNSLMKKVSENKEFKKELADLLSKYGFVQDFANALLKNDENENSNKNS